MAAAAVPFAAGAWRPLPDSTRSCERGPMASKIEGDVDHRNLGLHRGRGPLAAESGLQRQEGQDVAVGVGQDLAVQDAVPVQRPGRLDDLRELVADVVQVAAVEPDVGPAPVELGADAVVLVLHPDRWPQAGDDRGSVLGRRGEHELDWVQEAEARFVQALFPGEDGGLARVAGQHQGHAHNRLRVVERFGDGRLQEPLAQADAQLPGQDLDHVLGRERVAALQRAREDGALGGRPGCDLDGGECLRHFLERRGEARVRGFGAQRQHVGDGLAQVGAAIVGFAQSSGRRPRQVAHDGRDRGPAQADRPLIHLRKRPPGQESGSRAQLGSRQERQVPCEQRGLLRGASCAGDAIRQLTPAKHGADGIPSLREARSTLHGRFTLANRRPRWPRLLIANRGVRRPSWGRLVVLQRHRAENLRAFVRWYSDPEVARLTRYHEAPLSNDEIQRFFYSRIMGSDFLAMAIHVRDTDRLVGTCAFSQLDGDNGSTLYHITIGEPDAWGRGYGTEATELMLAHAFRRLALHRVALTVFEFNTRAIRAYEKCGFVVEGRARQAIFRDGRFWDEIHMSILLDEWEARQRLR